MISSFPPIEPRSARILVLGTMPGVASLEAQQYYAHPRNAFWAIMGSTLGFDHACAYPDRVEHLKANHIAVWDVLANCRREGSLDSNIKDEHPNDFAGFFARHRNIERILLNGGYASKLFRKYVKAPETVEVIAMPSTSPANARMRLEQKRELWQSALTL